MSLLSSLFKSSKKQNLTPDITPPDFNQSQFTVPLGKLAQQRIQAGTTGADTPGVGFGEDFVNKATNPVAEQMRRNFKQETLPMLSSQASSRGIGRSNLALKTIGQQEANVEGDINALMSKFYTLSEAQKKSDISEGINLGQQQQGAEIAQKNVQASASERLANATAADSRARETADRATAGNLLGATVPFVNPAGNAFGNILDKLGATGLSSALRPIGEQLSSGFNQNSIKTQTLGNDSSIEDIKKALLEMFGA